jgi:hypothetical protein
MTTKYIEVLNPTGKMKEEMIATVAGVGDLNGKVIGFVDNGKPNFDIFLSRLEELLSHKFEFAGVMSVKKGEKDTGKALNPEDMEKLAAKCHVVLNGICD